MHNQQDDIMSDHYDEDNYSDITDDEGHEPEVN